MAEKKEKNQMTCQCGMGMGMCGCGPHGHFAFRLIRAIFAVIILSIVFMLGVKIGELRGMLESRYGDAYRMMPVQVQGYGAYPMMRTGQGVVPTSTTSTAQ
jgi:hypothetical protein